MVRMTGECRLTAGQFDERGQLVLVAAAVLALALVPMAFAYLQLGYHGDVGADVEAETELGDTERSLERAVEHASGEIDGEYSWNRREAAVEGFRDLLEDDLDTIERLGHTEGVVIEIASAAEPASAWQAETCPSGPMRSFGPCERIDNVVVQERADETALLAAGFELRLATPDDEATVEVVVVVFA
ncbi:putative pilin/flagellin [Halalkaliarchaeum sp. AArc-CO]|uniref:DUF7261 family protein n=2 Tax=unclassified Halalkaliarchaeum TaxID=2678344 RepID=UPI00217D57C1|nr:hypothetical protein [Halalkaliarchaeum sp. AArc-CO]UWG49871.1 putative pilin/flagellin [Halalkaliarchaeum sp. AArc-CO]